ncbi:DUF4390 domain-containing protein [Dokdonella sp.]|uniref:DUF4390 domain-containing protein n=1 Tax=Dokdonella sp. TaxID=2291710 RepID=UPI0025B887B4|nr:DUF4390 domain-containing protein [Dokdonella sp.]MBX3689132.1 DUF4390 domain-containing protein [Dokdonella sp.]
MVCSKKPAEALHRSCAALLCLLTGLLLAGCGVLAHQTPGTLVVRQARLVAQDGRARLDLALDCQLSGPMQDALDNGIPLELEIDVRGRLGLRARPRIELRYFPLSRRYQLSVNGNQDERGFATRGYLLAALGSLRLELPNAFVQQPASAPLRVSAALDPAALPGALRLPALFEPAWHLAAAETTWPRATP